MIVLILTVVKGHLSYNQPIIAVVNRKIAFYYQILLPYSNKCSTSSVSEAARKITCANSLEGIFPKLPHLEILFIVVLAVGGQCESE